MAGAAATGVAVKPVYAGALASWTWVQATLPLVVPASVRRPYGFEIATIWYAPSGNEPRESAGIAIRWSSGAPSCVTLPWPDAMPVGSEGAAGSFEQNSDGSPRFRHVPQ